MKRTWTKDLAYFYVLMNLSNPSRGLKYCSALDYLRRLGITEADVVLSQKGGD